MKHNAPGPADLPVYRVARVSIVGVSIAVVLSFGGKLHWSLDLFAHQQRLYAVILVLAVAVVAAQRRWACVGVGAVAVVVTVARLSPLLVGSAVAPASDASLLSIVSFNVNTGNGAHAEVVDYLNRSDADLVVVLEVDRVWLGELERGLTHYQVGAAAPRPDNFGIALFVRSETGPGIDIGDTSVVFPTGEAHATPSVEASITVDGKAISLLGVHPLPPIGQRNAADNRSLLAAVARWSHQQSENAAAHVVLGDLNATPWSYAYRRLMRDTDLVDSLHGNGFGASWPVGVVSTLGLGIPIDHALHSPDLTTVERNLGPDLGSDHRPLELQLAWVRNANL